MPDLTVTPQASEVKFKQTTKTELKKIIMAFSNKSSCGYDEIPIKIIQFGSLYLLKPLIHLK